ncbi:hypothetical protein BLNAU_14242 [Blattamonas nauphoetae]|uniref:Uncharacterized protein n=1 Tax=Blattamonas nauphoetae TaxID=2049346 RepID=A0ABQ9XGL4_9EUKA|nr:hypothetical protein BLNAU_14242 [Blattamonas nauphoetae]
MVTLQVHVVPEIVTIQENDSPKTQTLVFPLWSADDIEAFESDLSNRNSSPTAHIPPTRDENNSQQDLTPQFTLD